MEKMAIEEKVPEPRYIDEDYAQKLLEEEVCERGLCCVKSGFKDMHRANYIGNESYAICLDKVKDCNFYVNAGYTCLCRCPVRIYIAKTFNK